MLKELLLPISTTTFSYTQSTASPPSRTSRRCLPLLTVTCSYYQHVRTCLLAPMMLWSVQCLQAAQWSWLLIHKTSVYLVLPCHPHCLAIHTNIAQWVGQALFQVNPVLYCCSDASLFKRTTISRKTVNSLFYKWFIEQSKRKFEDEHWMKS